MCAYTFTHIYIKIVSAFCILILFTRTFHICTYVYAVRLSMDTLYTERGRDKQILLEQALMNWALRSSRPRLQARWRGKQARKKYMAEQECLG